jgi:hypothetical protein
VRSPRPSVNCRRPDDRGADLDRDQGPCRRQSRIRGGGARDVWTASEHSDASHVRGFEMVAWGLRIHFDDRRPFTTVIFQDTAHLRGPRYFDCAEAVTGARPESNKPRS